MILFISHKANRGGAPMLLLEIIKEFKNQSRLPFRILLMEDGPLANEFKKLAPVDIWTRRRIRLPGTADGNPVNIFVSKCVTGLKGIQILFRIKKTDIVFSNTITNGHIHKKLLFLRCKWITYVHELEYTIHEHTSPKSLKTVLTGTDFFLCGSDAVRKCLTVGLQVPLAKTEVMYSSIAIIRRNSHDFQDRVNVLKSTLNIADSSVVVGIAAENEWRKGFDLFPSLVRLYLDLYPDSEARFIWMGIRPERPEYFGDMLDFKKYKIEKTACLISHSGTAYLDHMAMMDIHLLLSREDPFPLVVLDAASFSVPTICFQHAGGAPEFVGDDAGICVEYGNLYQMAKAIRQLELDEKLRTGMGRRAAEKLISEFDQKQIASRIIERIQQMSA